MKVLVDTVEYQAWHELGHATVCLHLGGDIDFIEFLDGHARGFARTRCIVCSGTERSVACGGFAAEFYLLNGGYAVQRSDDSRNISQVVFHNAAADREEFFERQLDPDEVFTVAEDEAFMNHAISVCVPILALYFPRMGELVRELCVSHRLDGKRVREVLLSSASPERR